jgi:diaminopimelate epimerase
MTIKFTKMHGAGNDFVVIDGIHQSIQFTPAQWQAIAHRQFGIGADQMLLVERSDLPGIDFKYRIINADGSEVEHCGNGSRCFVRFVHDQGLTDKTTIKVETLSGILTLQLQEAGRVTVQMGVPRFATNDIPFDATGLSATEVGNATQYTHPQYADTPFCVASMGNPHAVIEVADIETAPVQTFGPILQALPNFPKSVNVGFMQVLDPHHVKLRVYERGSGETLACGTGACAAVVTGIQRGVLQSPVQVQARGGVLEIAWAGLGEQVAMTGPTANVFSGEFETDALFNHN